MLAKPRVSGRKLDGHGWAEDGQAFVQLDDFLFVQPEQGVVQKLGKVPYFFACELQIGLDRCQ